MHPELQGEPRPVSAVPAASESWPRSLSMSPSLGNKLEGHPRRGDPGEGVCGHVRPHRVQRGRKSSRPQRLLMGRALKPLELPSEALGEGSFVRMQKSQGCLGRSAHLGLRGMLG